MKLSHAALLFISAFCILGTARSSEPAPTRPEVNRWLLIVDTSAAMEKRSKAVEGVLAELLKSGMNGQMQPGDELGIWTFNKELYAGVAPIQVWNPGKSNLITKRTVGFIGRQIYRGTADYKVLKEDLTRVVASSEKLTVVLFTDGSQKVTGTTLDDTLNESFAHNQAVLKHTRMPLAAILRAYRGKFIGQYVTVAPWPVSFPPFPAEPVKTNVVAAAAPPPHTEAKPIIITRESSKLQDAAKPAESIQPPSPETAKPAPVIPPQAAVPAEIPQPTPPAASATAPLPAEPAPVPATASQSATKAVPAEPVASASAAIANSKPDPIPVAVHMESPAPAPTEAREGMVLARKWPLLLSFALLSVAMVMTVVLVSRSRKTNTASLITQSYDQRPE